MEWRPAAQFADLPYAVLRRPEGRPLSDYNAPLKKGTTLFETIDRLKPDQILGLMAQFRADPFPQKVDLGVGVYRDPSGNTPVLECVRRAEQLVIAEQSTKSYVAAAGREEYNTAVETLVLGPRHPARTMRRTRTAQTPGGCGALRVGAEAVRAIAPATVVRSSDPTLGLTRRSSAAAD